MKKLLTFLSIFALFAPISSCGTAEEVADSQLSADVLIESLGLGTQFMLNNQKDEGNFQYEFNLVSEEYTDDDNQVRQAGAVWGLSTIHQVDLTADTRKATTDGLDYFYDISNTAEWDNGRWAEYPGDEEGSSGTMALITMALTDLLDTDVYLADREKYEMQLDDYVKFLLSLKRSDNLFYKNYELGTGFGYGGETSPYFDGEILLALTKYAKAFDHPELEEIIIDSAQSMYDKYVTEGLENDPDSSDTKGFYQWGSMAFYELYNSDWTDDKYAQWTIDLAYWMIDVHQTLNRSRNTGYAYEGIIAAYELAKATEDKRAETKFLNVINEGLYELTTWQVGHSIQNEYLQNHKTGDPRAVGGVMNAKAEPTLRIDVAQHQMHAVILALKALF